MYTRVPASTPEDRERPGTHHSLYTQQKYTGSGKYPKEVYASQGTKRNKGDLIDLPITEQTKTLSTKNVQEITRQTPGYLNSAKNGDLQRDMIVTSIQNLRDLNHSSSREEGKVPIKITNWRNNSSEMDKELERQQELVVKIKEELLQLGLVDADRDTILPGNGSLSREFGRDITTDIESEIKLKEAQVQVLLVVLSHSEPNSDPRTGTLAVDFILLFPCKLRLSHVHSSDFL